MYCLSIHPSPAASKYVRDTRLRFDVHAISDAEEEADEQEEEGEERHHSGREVRAGVVMAVNANGSCAWVYLGLQIVLTWL